MGDNIPDARDHFEDLLCASNSLVTVASLIDRGDYAQARSLAGYYSESIDETLKRICIDRYKEERP